jgi:hypothetical protein
VSLSSSPSASPLRASELPLLVDPFYSAAVPQGQRAAEPVLGSRLVAATPGKAGTSEMSGVVFRTGDLPCVLTRAVVPLHFGPSYATSQRTYEARLFALAGADALRPDAESLGAGDDGVRVLALTGTEATLPYLPAAGFAGFANFSFEVAPGSDAAARTLAARSWFALGFGCASGCSDSSDAPTTYGEEERPGRARRAARAPTRTCAPARSRARSPLTEKCRRPRAPAQPSGSSRAATRA